MSLGAFSGAAALLDKICTSITGVKKAYIVDQGGAVLAESSGTEGGPRLQLVRTMPAQYERFKKMQSSQFCSFVVEVGQEIMMCLLIQPLFLVFVCSQDANLALLQQLPEDMSEIVEQFRAFDTGNE